MNVHAMPAVPAAPPRKPGRKGAPGWRRRLDVAGRGVLAIFGGYAVAALATALLSRLVPASPVERITAATLLSFALYCAVAIWVFADNRAWRIWLGMVLLIVGLAGGLFVSLQLEPRL